MRRDSPAHKAAEEQHRGRLRESVFHHARDEESKSSLVGLELPDWQYWEVEDRSEVETTLRNYTNAMFDLFLNAWERHHET